MNKKYTYIIVIAFISQFILSSTQFSSAETKNWEVLNERINAEEIELPEPMDGISIFLRNDVLWLLGGSTSDGLVRLYKYKDNWTLVRIFGRRRDWGISEGRSLYVTTKGYIVIAFQDSQRDKLYFSKTEGNTFELIQEGELNTLVFWKAVEDRNGHIYMGLYGRGSNVEHYPRVTKLDPISVKFSTILNLPSPGNHVNDLEIWNKNLYIVLGDSPQEVWRYDLLEEKLYILFRNEGEHYNHIYEILGGITDATSTKEGLFLSGGSSGFALCTGENLSQSYYESWIDRKQKVNNTLQEPMSGWDASNIDDLVYNGHVALNYNYSTWVTVYSPKLNTFKKLINIKESETSWSGVKQISRESTTSGWIYCLYSITLEDTRIYGIIRFTKLNEADLEQEIHGNKMNLEQIVHSYKPFRINLTKTYDTVVMKFEKYSMVDRIIKLENFTDFNNQTWRFNETSVSWEYIPEESSHNRTGYLKLTAIDEDPAQIIERGFHMTKITPDLEPGSHVVSFMIYKTKPSAITHTTSFLSNILQQGYIDSERKILTTRTNNDDWTYQWSDLTTKRRKNESRIEIRLNHGETLYSLTGMYVTNGTNGFYPPVTGTHMPRTIIINGKEYLTDKQIVLRDLSSLEIILPPDGCGSIKFSTSYPEFSIPDKRDDNLLVTANFEVHQQMIKPGAEIKFQDSSKSFKGELNSWSWDFGDGATSNEQNPSHLYEISGTYSVTLNVTNEIGGQNTVTKRITIPKVYDLELQIIDIFGFKIPNEIVNIYYEGNLIEQKTTDKNGQIIVKGIPEGKYHIEFSNFKEKNIEIFIVQQTTKQIQVMFSKNAIYIVGLIISIIIAIEIFIIQSTKKT
jgi:hypothetical protein